MDATRNISVAQSAGREDSVAKASRAYRTKTQRERKGKGRTGIFPSEKQHGGDKGGRFQLFIAGI